MYSKTKDFIKLNEGLKLKSYLDTKGYVTWGYGRNLQVKGGTEAEASYFLDNDISEILQELPKRISFFNELDEVRQTVLIDIAYNCGIDGLLGFDRMLKALAKRDYNTAAYEVEDSETAPKRRKRNAYMMSSGQWWDS